MCREEKLSTRDRGVTCYPVCRFLYVFSHFGFRFWWEKKHTRKKDPKTPICTTLLKPYTVVGEKTKKEEAANHVLR